MAAISVTLVPASRETRIASTCASVNLHDQPRPVPQPGHYYGLHELRSISRPRPHCAKWMNILSSEWQYNALEVIVTRNFDSDITQLHSSLGRPQFLYDGRVVARN